MIPQKMIFVHKVNSINFCVEITGKIWYTFHIICSLFLKIREVIFLYIKNMYLHLRTILKHKKEVFKLCCVAGIPFQGIIHDMSKFSPTEFFESVKYFSGDRSPIMNCKDVNGYSLAWQHHKGRNKHHPEYWVDKLYSGGVPIKIPYKYSVEMACDIIAASKTYNGKNFNETMPYEYWVNKLKPTTLIHPANQKFIRTLLRDYSKYGEKALNMKHTKKLYNKISKSGEGISWKN